jgi:hypothetical protein
MTETLSVAPGETVTITELRKLSKLSIAEGATLTAPEGHALVLTVDGVDQGQRFVPVTALETTLVPGEYAGEIVIEVVKDLPRTIFDMVTFHSRTAVVVDEDGVVAECSALSAVTHGEIGTSSSKGIEIVAEGDGLTAFRLNGGHYELTNPTIRYTGQGRGDYGGQGISVVAIGPTADLVLDGADIRTHGAMAGAVLAHAGARLLVKNSYVETVSAPLPDDYEERVTPDLMTVPWPLGLYGNVRATATLGDKTRATYLNSTLKSTNWGVLATDAVDSNVLQFSPEGATVDLSKRLNLTAIDVDAEITGDSGYGAYADGNAIDTFLGVRFTNVSLGLISGGGPYTLDDSTPANVREINERLDLGLSDADIAGVKSRPTTIDSTGFGALLHQWDGASLDVRGGTTIRSANTAIVVKTIRAQVSIDGSKGARIEPDNGVLVQLMDSDDVLINDNKMMEPYTRYVTNTGPATRSDGWSLTEFHDTLDTTVALTDIALTGDIYNSVQGLPAYMAVPRPGQNLHLTLTRSELTGVISSSLATHRVDTIGPDNRLEIGMVTNTAAPAVNNGVVLTLGEGSTWIASGTSYLTSLTVASGATLLGEVTVDGQPAEAAPGTTLTGTVVVTAR